MASEQVGVEVMGGQDQELAMDQLQHQLDLQQQEIQAQTQAALPSAVPPPFPPPDHYRAGPGEDSAALLPHPDQAPPEDMQGNGPLPPHLPTGKEAAVAPQDHRPESTEMTFTIKKPDSGKLGLVFAVLPTDFQTERCKLGVRKVVRGIAPQDVLDQFKLFDRLISINGIPTLELMDVVNAIEPVEADGDLSILILRDKVVEDELTIMVKKPESGKLGLVFAQLNTAFENEKYSIAVREVKDYAPQEAKDQFKKFDMLLSINGTAAPNLADFSEVVSSVEVGGDCIFTVLRTSHAQGWGFVNSAVFESREDDMGSDGSEASSNEEGDGEGMEEDVNVSDTAGQAENPEEIYQGEMFSESEEDAEDTNKSDQVAKMHWEVFKVGVKKPEESGLGLAFAQIATSRGGSTRQYLEVNTIKDTAPEEIKTEFKDKDRLLKLNGTSVFDTEKLVDLLKEIEPGGELTFEVLRSVPDQHEGYSSKPCDRCTELKVKCGRHYPHCHNCLRVFGAECKYPNDFEVSDAAPKEEKPRYCKNPCKRCMEDERLCSKEKPSCAFCRTKELFCDYAGGRALMPGKERVWSSLACVRCTRLRKECGREWPGCQACTVFNKIPCVCKYPSGAAPSPLPPRPLKKKLTPTKPKIAREKSTYLDRVCLPCLSSYKSCDRKYPRCTQCVVAEALYKEGGEEYDDEDEDETEEGPEKFVRVSVYREKQEEQDVSDSSKSRKWVCRRGGSTDPEDCFETANPLPSVDHIIQSYRSKSVLDLLAKCTDADYQKFRRQVKSSNQKNTAQLFARYIFLKNFGKPLDTMSDCIHCLLFGCIMPLPPRLDHCLYSIFSKFATVFGEDRIHLGTYILAWSAVLPVIGLIDKRAPVIGSSKKLGFNCTAALSQVVRNTPVDPESLAIRLTDVRDSLVGCLQRAKHKIVHLCPHAQVVHLCPESELVPSVALPSSATPVGAGDPALPDLASVNRTVALNCPGQHGLQTAMSNAMVFDFCSSCKQLMLPGQSYLYCIQCMYYVCASCSIVMVAGAEDPVTLLDAPEMTAFPVVKSPKRKRPMACSYPPDAKKRLANKRKPHKTRRSSKFWTFEIQVQKPKGSLGLLLTEPAWPNKRVKRPPVTVRGFHKSLKRVRSVFQPGDEILSLNGKEILNATDVSTESSKVKQGQFLTFFVKRSNLKEELKVLIVKKPVGSLGMVIRVGRETAGKAMLKSVQGASDEIKRLFKKDDEIVSINGKAIAAPEDIVEVLEKVEPGQDVQFCINRMVMKSKEDIRPKKRPRSSPMNAKIKKEEAKVKEVVEECQAEMMDVEALVACEPQKSLESEQPQEPQEPQDPQLQQQMIEGSCSLCELGSAKVALLPCNFHCICTICSTKDANAKLCPICSSESDINAAK